MPARRFERLCLMNVGDFCTSNSSAVWESSFIVSLLEAVYCFEIVGGVSLLLPLLSLWEGLGTFIRDEKKTFSSLFYASDFFSRCCFFVSRALSAGGFGWIEKRSENLFCLNFPTLTLGWRFVVVSPLLHCIVHTLLIDLSELIQTHKHTQFVV